MFELFTDRARLVVVLAQEEARNAPTDYIGPEHLLLGILFEGESTGAQALANVGIGRDEARKRVLECIETVDAAPSGHIPFTPRMKKVLEFALREALQLGHRYIGVEHIVLGLVREGESVAAQVLTEMGVDLSSLRREVIRLLTEQGSVEPEKPTESARYIELLDALERVKEMASGLSDPIGQHLHAAICETEDQAARALLAEKRAAQ